jgi:hypothetical protein
MKIKQSKYPACECRGECGTAHGCPVIDGTYACVRSQQNMHRVKGAAICHRCFFRINKTEIVAKMQAGRIKRKPQPLINQLSLFGDT